MQRALRFEHAWWVQVLSVVTVGNDQDGLSLETALGMETSNFISHFTCPSFAVNEVCCHDPSAPVRHTHRRTVFPCTAMSLCRYGA